MGGDPAPASPPMSRELARLIAAGSGARQNLPASLHTKWLPQHLPAGPVSWSPSGASASTLSPSPRSPFHRHCSLRDPWKHKPDLHRTRFQPTQQPLPLDPPAVDLLPLLAEPRHMPASQLSVCLCGLLSPAGHFLHLPRHQGATPVSSCRKPFPRRHAPPCFPLTTF